MKYQEYGFKDRIALITGAGTGVGRAVAEELAKGGAKLALFGRRLEKLEETREECLKYTDDVLALSVDVGVKEQVDGNVGKVLNHFGKVDILVNNAGFERRLAPGESFWETYFDKLTPEEYLQNFKTHTLGHYLMNNAVIPSMIGQRFGRIVNVTSILGITPGFETPAYSGSKAAAISQTAAFAKKYGKYNITVNALAPGMINTPMKIDSTPEEFEACAEAATLKRIAEPIDIARVVLFFAQEDLLVTGQVLQVGV